LTVGGEIRAHDGHHVGTVVSGNGITPGTEADQRYYDYHPRTLAAGAFAHEEWNRGALQVTADLGWRHEAYHMRDDRLDGVTFDQPHAFAPPRPGRGWSGGGGGRLPARAARSGREPAFRALYDGEGVGNVPLMENGEPLIKPEQVNDFEGGLNYLSRHFKGE